MTLTQQDSGGWLLTCNICGKEFSIWDQQFVAIFWARQDG
jgi:hypothetical protein